MAATEFEVCRGVSRSPDPAKRRIRHGNQRGIGELTRRSFYCTSVGAADGNFVELWQTDLVSGESRAGSVLDGITWIGTDGFGSSAAYHNGRWEVRISRQLGPLAGLQDFSTAGILTLGIALHGADNAGGAHWVSLPLTLSFGGDDTDLSAE